jgi:hypothetical protein
MITIAFLICLQSGQCFATSADIVVTTMEQCNVVGRQLILNNQEAVYRGEAPPHTAYFQCVEWGEPA